MNTGVISMGIKCPIIREGDDIANIVVDSVLSAWKKKLKSAKKYYNKYIKAANVVVCLSQANTRAYKQDEDFYTELIESNIISSNSRIILGINKIDLIFKSDEHLAGIDLSTITDDNALIKDKIDDYYGRVFSKIFSKFSTVNIDAVVAYSNLQQWNMERLAHKIFSNL